MAVNIISKAGFAFDAAWFLRLDSVGLEYKTALKKPIRQYFQDYGLTIQNQWLNKKAIGLFSRVGEADFNTSIEDSLKTHPDCKERYVFISSLLATAGYNKYYYRDATIFKLSPNNRFSRVTTISQAKSANNFAQEIVMPGNTRNIIDEEGLNAYFVGGDGDNVSITNINTKKTKFIPHSSGNIMSSAYPAKEGHFMLVENNNSTKSVKLSIVPLQ